MPSEHREKAVEAANNALLRYVESNSLEAETARAARDALDDAEPHLQRMYFERFREAVLSEAENLERPNEPGEDLTAASIRKVKAQGIRDALTKAQEIMEEADDAR